MTDSASGPLLVTGAGGWIGSRLTEVAAARGRAVRAIDARRPVDAQHPAGAGGTLIHLAAIAHRTGGVDRDAYLGVNRDLPVSIATQALRLGVRRFVFVSTARVMGEVSVRPWTTADPPAPVDDYSEAKLQAEARLRALHEPGRFEVVVLRPPLVHGPGVGANLSRLLRLASTRWPLPVDRDAGPRSMVGLDNLVDLLQFLVDREAPDGPVWFVRDDVDWTTPQLVEAVRRELGRPARLVGVPSGWVRAAMGAAGASRLHRRLFGAAQVDDGPLRAFGWKPPVAAPDALRATIRASLPR